MVLLSYRDDWGLPLSFSTSLFTDVTGETLTSPLDDVSVTSVLEDAETVTSGLAGGLLRLPPRVVREEVLVLGVGVLAAGADLGSRSLVEEGSGGTTEALLADVTTAPDDDDDADDDAAAAVAAVAVRAAWRRW